MEPHYGHEFTEEDLRIVRFSLERTKAEMQTHVGKSLYQDLIDKVDHQLADIEHEKRHVDGED